MKKVIIYMLFLFSAVSLFSMTDAAISQKINFQGQLTNAAGKPVTGTLAMTFTIYDALTAGSTLKTITNSAVTFSETGLYNVELDLTGLNLNQDLWLGITVGSDSEMTPRAPILPSASSIFSLTSQTAQTAVSSQDSSSLGGASASSYLLKSGGTLTGQLNLGSFSILISSSIEGISKIKWADGSMSTHAASGSGADMTKATYDTNSNNIVDNADKLGGALPSAYMPVSGGTFTGNVYTVGYSSASAFYGDGSNLRLGRSYGEMFTNSNAAGTTIAAINTPTKVAPATSDGNLNNFANSTAGRLTYSGTKPGVFKCNVSLTAFAALANQTVTFSIAKNGNMQAKSQVQTVLAATADKVAINVTCLVQLNTSEYVELWVANNSGTTTLTVSYMNFNVVEIE